MPPVYVPGKGTFNPNPTIRCPLPPFNAGIDTLRQFDGDSGDTPRRRVIPLPVQSLIGSGGNITQNTTVISSSGSGGTSVALTAKSVVYTSPLLSAGDFDSQSIVMAKSYQLISCLASGPCEIRLYGDPSSQGLDSGRPTDSPVPAELLNNLVTDIVFENSPFVWTWQNRVGTNSEVPQTTNAYITAFNTGSFPVAIQVTLVFLPLEQ